jgi:dTDP-4-amino-4,6-dideoxygalactose transaminase
MTEVQSAIGRVALRRLDDWVAARRSHAEVLHDALSSCAGLRLASPPAGCWHSYYKFYAFVRPETLAAGWCRDRIVAEISRAGVPCFTGSCSEIYLENCFPPSLRPAERLPVAKSLGETSLMLLVHPTLTEQQLYAAGRVVQTVMRQATVV